MPLQGVAVLHICVRGWAIHCYLALGNELMTASGGALLRAATDPQAVATWWFRGTCAATSRLRLWLMSVVN